MSFFNHFEYVRYLIHKHINTLIFLCGQRRFDIEGHGHTMSALYVASYYRDVDIINRLLQALADVNLQNNKGGPAL